MRKFDVRQITLCAMVAALYAVLSYFGSIFGLTYGPIQFRVAVALGVRRCRCPATAPGLVGGGLITNLRSPVGRLDVVFGSLATLLAALWTSRMPNRWLAPLPPVLCNGVIIGAMIAWYEVGFGPGFWGMFAFNGLTVALGELGACYVLGSLLLTVLPKIRPLQPLLSRRACRTV